MGLVRKVTFPHSRPMEGQPAHCPGTLYFLSPAPSLPVPRKALHPHLRWILLSLPPLPPSGPSTIGQQKGAHQHENPRRAGLSPFSSLLSNAWHTTVFFSFSHSLDIFFHWCGYSYLYILSFRPLVLVLGHMRANRAGPVTLFTGIAIHGAEKPDTDSFIPLSELHLDM